MEAFDDEIEFIPEKRLLVAVLIQAVRDAYYPRFDKFLTFESQRDDAIEWLHSKSTEPFSFEWIKEILNINKSDEKIVEQVLTNQIQINGLKVNKFNIENVPQFCIIKGKKFYLRNLYKGGKNDNKK